MTSKQVKEFFDALKLISSEKGLELTTLIEKLRAAIVLAVKKQFYGVDKINVVIDLENNLFKVSFFKLVVPVVKNFANEIQFDDALKISKRAKLGELLEIEVDSKKLGRLAAGAAKQQIMQGIRDIEKENIAERMEGKVGNLISAPVELVDHVGGNVVLKIDGNDVVLFKNSQLPNDDFKVGDIVKVFAVNLDSSGSGCLLKISRTHPDFVRKLFEVEVPEIQDGKIEIKKIAREPGVRTKIAVLTNDVNLEPVGCCIGNRGVRINAIVSELGGEKIDVVKFSSEADKFVEFALLPAKISKIKVVNLNDDEKMAFVAVKPSQISLAIGSGGLNAKLAAFLTGYKIDIFSEDILLETDFETIVKNKLKEKVKISKKNMTTTVKVETPVKKTEQELLEEEDLYNFEVARMLD